MKKIFLILFLLLSGCTTTTDTSTILILSKRIEQLESKKSEVTDQKMKIDILVPSDAIGAVVNPIDNTHRKITIEVYVDKQGNFIIPPERLVKRYELKLDK